MGSSMTTLASSLQKVFTPARAFRPEDQGLFFEAEDPNVLLKRRNLLTYSEQFDNAAWIKAGATIAANDVAAPDGNTTADKLVENTSGSRHELYQQNFNARAGFTHTFSISVKPAGRTSVEVQITDTASGDYRAIVNLTSGSVTNQVTTGNWTAGSCAAAVVNGWCNIVVIITKTANANAIIQPSICLAQGATTNYTGDGTSGVHLWGAQVEYGLVATLYQPVTDWTTEYAAAVGSLCSMFQDSAGTTPVTAVEQPVGMVRDKRYGGATGPELSPDPEINTSGSWLTGTNVSVSGGVINFTGAVATNGAFIQTGVAFSTTKLYQITGAVDSISGGTLRVLFGTGAIVADVSAAGRFIFCVAPNAAGTSLGVRAQSGTVTAVVSSLSVREVYGVHATQATSSARPTGSARYNLLTKTEQLDDAAWTKTNGATVTANNATAPDGNMSADQLVASTATYRPQGLSAASVIAGQPYRFRVSFKPGAYPMQLHVYDGATNTGVVVSTGGSILSGAYGGSIPPGASVTAVDSYGFYGVQFSFTPATSSVTLSFVYDGTPTAGASLGHFWGANLRLASDAALAIPAYQRVNTATDYDTDNFPFYAKYDGTDDNLVTASGGGQTTGFFYCAAITSMGGAGTARTLWSDTGTNTGFRVRLDASNQLELAAGDGTKYTVAHDGPLAAGSTYIVSAWYDGQALQVQIDNRTISVTACTSVSAGTAAITEGKDNGAATSYFNGRIHGRVYNTKYPGATAHDNIKKYLAKQIGLKVLQENEELAALDWQTRAVAAGGTVSATTFRAVANYVRDAKKNGVWSKLVRNNLFAGGQLAACLVPLKVGGGNSTDTNVNFASGDYTEATGLTGDGSSKSLNTGITFAMVSSANMAMGVYAAGMETSGVSNARCLMGNLEGGDSFRGISLSCQWDFAANARRFDIVGASGSAVPSWGTVLTPAAFVHGGAVGDGTYRIFENGVEKNSVTATITNASNNLGSILVFARGDGDANTPVGWTASSIRSYYIGTALTAAEQATLYTIMQAFQTALGRNV